MPLRTSLSVIVTLCALAMAQPTQAQITIFEADFDASLDGRLDAATNVADELNTGTAVGSWVVSNVQESLISHNDANGGFLANNGRYNVTANFAQTTPLAAGTTISCTFYARQIVDGTNRYHNFKVFDSEGRTVIYLRFNINAADTVLNNRLSHFHLGVRTDIGAKGDLSFNKSSDYNPNKNTDVTLVLSATTMDIYLDGSRIAGGRDLVYKDTEATDVASIGITGGQDICGAFWDNFLVETNPLPAADYDPGALDFVTPSATPQTLETVVTNIGLAPLDISNISILDQSHLGSFAVTAGATPPILAPGETATVEVTFDPTVAPAPIDDYATGTMVVTSNHTGTPGTTQDIALSGFQYQADSFLWNGPNGLWTNASNWTPNGVPNTGDTVEVRSGTTTCGANLYVTNQDNAPGAIHDMDVTGGELLFDTGGLRVVEGQVDVTDGLIESLTGSNTIGSDDFGSTQAGILNLTTGTLRAKTFFQVGVNGSAGAFTMQNGLVDAGYGGDSNVRIGNNGGHGVVTMQDGTIRATRNVLLATGGAGTAEMTQNGGQVEVGRILMIADNAGSVATYQINGGSVSVADELQVGRRGDGAFTITGGSVEVTNEVRVGGDGVGNVNGRGTLNVSGGRLKTPSNIRLGDEDGASHGALNITGSGVVEAASYLTVGRVSTGALTIADNGQLTVGTSLSFGSVAAGVGFGYLTGGSLVCQEIRVGVDGLAYLELSGTDVIATSSLTLARDPSSSTSLTMTGGSVVTPLLQQGAGELYLFGWTGGRIAADAIAIPDGVVNTSGRLSPGLVDDVGATVFAATDYTQASGATLEVTIDGAVADQVHLTTGSQATLSGTLDVTLANPLTYGVHSWDIVTTDMSGAAIVDNGITVNAPFLPGGTSDWALTVTASVVTLSLEYREGAGDLPAHKWLLY